MVGDEDAAGTRSTATPPQRRRWLRNMPLVACCHRRARHRMWENVASQVPLVKCAVRTRRRTIGSEGRRLSTSSVPRWRAARPRSRLWERLRRHSQGGRPEQVVSVGAAAGDPIAVRAYVDPGCRSAPAWLDAGAENPSSPPGRGVACDVIRAERTWRHKDPDGTKPVQDFDWLPIPPARRNELERHRGYKKAKNWGEGQRRGDDWM